MEAATKWLCWSLDIRVAECRMWKIILQYFCSHCSVSVTPPLQLLQLIMCPQQSNITCNLPAHSVEPHNDQSSPSRVWIHQNIWTKIKLSGVRCSGWPAAAVTSQPDMQAMFANIVHLHFHTLRLHEEIIMNRCSVKTPPKSGHLYLKTHHSLGNAQNGQHPLHVWSELCTLGSTLNGSRLLTIVSMSCLFTAPFS